MYKLIVFDLDGTLLDDYKAVPEANMEALCRAAGKGLLIVPASGRIYRFMPEEVISQPFVRYCITVNGAAVYDAAQDEVLYSAEISLDEAFRVFDYLDSLDVIYDFYADNVGYINNSFIEIADDYFQGPVMNSMLHSYTLKTRIGVPDIRQFALQRGGSLLKISVFFKHGSDRILQLDKMPGVFPELVFSSSLPNNIEINSPLATKGQALQDLCLRLGIAPDEVIAFGDGTNDLDMIRFAGTGVAMANADSKVKDAASYVTASNNEAGVALALRHFGIV